MKTACILLLFCANTMSVFAEEIDASTLSGKVICGYQGWFRAKGDGDPDFWVHWSRSGHHVSMDNLVIDMWPDMREYAPSDMFPVPNMKHADGRQACLFSSTSSGTVDLHFKWMQDYGIDGIQLQRFAVGLIHGGWQSRSADRVLGNVRSAANKYGRVFYIAYDLAMAKDNSVFEAVTQDWTRLVDSGVTDDPRYLKHNGKPMLGIHGIWDEPGRNPSFDSMDRIVNFIRNNRKYDATLYLGTKWDWRSHDDKWKNLYKKFDVLSPWNVGNWDGHGSASMKWWQEDMQEARSSGRLYVPTVYPGFSWHNLNKGKLNQIPRRKGLFLWEQFYTSKRLGVDSIYVAMFDEVDEGTAIFKVTDDPPVGPSLVTYEGCGSDFYLKLTGTGTKMFRNIIPIQETIPDIKTNRANGK